MGLYEQVADLPLTVESVECERRERETPKFTRATTVVTLSGGSPDGGGTGGSAADADDAVVGVGEDVTYAEDRHPAPEFDLAGEYTLAEFSRALGELDLFPDADPDHDVARNYRRWAFESAALDLALRRADTHLGAALDRAYDPVRFVVSPTLGDPPSADVLRTWRDRNSDLEFKLDAGAGWTPDLVAELADLGVRVVDFKALYDDPEVAGNAGPDLYERITENLPDAILEDPAWTDETRAALADSRDRISWDVPITSVESVGDRPFDPDWLNVKPSRFGSVESLLDTVEYCEERDISMYGGGQFELGAGRRQIQLLASLFYSDSPNDVAPSGYNDATPADDLPSSPLSMGEVRGFR